MSTWASSSSSLLLCTTCILALLPVVPRVPTAVHCRLLPPALGAAAAAAVLDELTAQDCSLALAAARRRLTTSCPGSASADAGFLRVRCCFSAAAALAVSIACTNGAGKHRAQKLVGPHEPCVFLWGARCGGDAGWVGDAAASIMAAKACCRQSTCARTLHDVEGCRWMQSMGLLSDSIRYTLTRCHPETVKLPSCSPSVALQICGS
jgi:hypothetical protein